MFGGGARDEGEPQVGPREYEERLGQRGVVVWLTGLSAAGKTTLARRMARRLFERGKVPVILDGDDVRSGLNRDLGFSEDDRQENIRRVAHLAELMADKGLIVLCAFITPTKAIRARARAIVTPERLVEVYVNADLDTCIGRDPKGLYKRALSGELEGFTGVSAAWEAPENPDIVVDTAHLSPDGAAEIVEQLLRERGLLT